MMTCSVLLAHPGTQYASHLARELAAHAMLRRFWTGFALAAQGWGGRLLAYAPAALRKRLGNRVVNLAGQQLRTRPLLEWRAGREASRVGEETAFFERNRRFQEVIPRHELDAVNTVIGFDTSSWILARRTKQAGRRFILDQSIGHPAAKERVFAGLRERFPAWSTSAPKKAPELVAAEREEHALADVIVVPSRFVRRTLVDEGVDAAKIRIIPFGTDLTLFQPAERSDETSGPVVFLYVGGITARKGVPVLLQAWRQWGPTNAELWLAGPGAIPADELATLPASVKVLGSQGRSEVAALMRKADVFVFPSFFEGLAQVQIEAQAAGLPLIGTEESGASELVEDGRTGCLVPAGDVGALSAAMQRLAEDAALRAQMRQNAIASRERLSWKVYGDRWASLVAEVGSSQNPGSSSPATESKPSC